MSPSIAWAAPQKSPDQFYRSCLAPSPEARDAVSFGLEYIFYTAASDSEDFGAASLDVLPPSGQEARPSPAYTELVEVLARATEKLSLDWPDEPRKFQSSFGRYFLVPKKDGGLRPILDLRRLNYSLYKGKFRMLTLKSILSQVQEGDWFVTVDLKDAYFPIQVGKEAQEVLQVRLRGKGLPAQGSSLWASSGPKDVHQMYGCSSGPAEAPGYPNPQLPG